MKSNDKPIGARPDVRAKIIRGRQPGSKRQLDHDELEASIARERGFIAACHIFGTLAPEELDD